MPAAVCTFIVPAGDSKVILCVLPATADFATQEAIKISRYIKNVQLAADPKALNCLCWIVHRPAPVCAYIFAVSQMACEQADCEVHSLTFIAVGQFSAVPT